MAHDFLLRIRIARISRDFSRWFYCSKLYFYVFEGGVVALTEEFEWNEISTIHWIAPLVLHKVAYIRTSIFTVNNIQCCIFEPFFDHFSLILNVREVKINAAYLILKHSANR